MKRRVPDATTGKPGGAFAQRADDGRAAAPTAARRPRVAVRQPAGIRERAKVLAITLDSMWSVKDYMLSGTFAALSEEWALTAWVPDHLLEDTRALAKQLGLDAVALRPALPQRRSALVEIVCGIQKAVLFERCDIDTERVMRMREPSTSVRARSRWSKAASRLIRWTAKSPLADPIESFLEAARRWLTRGDPYREELDRVKPDAVLMTDPVRRDFDPLYYEAKRRSIPVATLVLSWDNLTAKGRIHSGYDLVMVWNDPMRAELLRLYPSIDPRRMQVVGFPRFDVYLRPLPPPFERDAFLRSLGLDPSGRVVLFANGATRSFRAQPQVIEHLCAAIDSGDLPDDVQLLVRCHPHDEIALYERFRCRRRVAVWPRAADVRNATLFEQAPQAGELLVLAASVRHSAVCVNPGSTVMLDAAIADVPIVCVAYDGDEALPYWQSFGSSYEYSHQQVFHTFGATVICRSRAELIRAVQLALSAPSAKAQQRSAVVDNYLGGNQSAVARLRSALSMLAASGTSLDERRRA